MKLIVGLGNPGGTYKKTYHNLGYMVVDFFAKQHNIKISKNKCLSKIYADGQVVLAKPQTFMNLSGDALLQLKKYFKIKNADILVVLDDIDLSKGQIRFRKEGSAGTHNGLKDIIAKIGQTPRLRVGIGRSECEELADYVLSDIDAKSKILIDDAILNAQQVIQDFITGKLDV